MSFSIRVPSLITPVYCIRQTEEPEKSKLAGGYSLMNRTIGENCSC
ncbi:hypothetical protein BH695_0216 [Microcystis aeruginosa PCC 7806SL]|uniref:Uncharacterized protein n=1 Tax=Microcystis aeruginosa PCC 7806SL TaxID=1903187 RepID=A0AB33BEZ3_MICA7|nr:hypothetical protein BH695_0216 [Microcystis aeruginosa PCC 7806SL]